MTCQPLSHRQRGLCRKHLPTKGRAVPGNTCGQLGQSSRMLDSQSFPFHRLRVFITDFGVSREALSNGTLPVR